MRTILISGGFDPLHVGHIRYIEDAKKYGDVIIALNSDSWLKRKKGYVFMTWYDRKEILEAISDVMVVQVDDSDDTVVPALREVTPTYFGNGGDRTFENTPELDACEQIGIEPVFGLGGDKVRSSSDLVECRNKTIVNKPWGSYEVLHEAEDHKVKILTIWPRSSLSLQTHINRCEFWTVLEGEGIFQIGNKEVYVRVGNNETVPATVMHRIKNNSGDNLKVLEVQWGNYLGEDDIVRYEDDYGREGTNR